jgi:hypothetical protein
MAQFVTEPVVAGILPLQTPVRGAFPRHLSVVGRYRRGGRRIARVTTDHLWPRHGLQIQPHSLPIEHPQEKEMRPRALGAIGSILALTPACCLAANPLGPGQLFWILGANAYNAMLNTSISGSPDAATLLDGYFNTTSTYVIVYNEDPSGNGVIKQSPYYNEVRQRLPRANLVLDVINETTLESYLNSGSVDPNVEAVMYDDEGGAAWGTSSTEKAYPGYYIPRAKAAIDSYNAKYGTHLILLSVPARSYCQFPLATSTTW